MAEKTVKLYQEDVDRKECTGSVQSILTEKNQVLLVLDQSVFFPEGGGQNSDHGTIDGYPVPYVFEREGLVYHEIDKKYAAEKGLADPLAYFTPSKQVHCEIHWASRFEAMQRHCGEHILSGMFFREFGGVNRGFHMGEEYMTIDVSLEENPKFVELTMEMALQVERCANEAIWQNLPVTVRHFNTKAEAETLPLRKKLSIESDISIVCVGDPMNPADSVACCGTHPKYAGQVGLVKIYKVESNKGMFRVYCEAGKRALADYDKKHEVLTKLNNRYSASTDDLWDKIGIAEEKTKALRTELHTLKQSVIKERIALIAGDLAALNKTSMGAKQILVYEYDDMKVDDLLLIGRPLLDKIKKLLLIIDTSTNTLLLFSDGTIDCGKLVKENAQIYNGKGGGNKNSARALFTKREYVETFIDLIEKHLR